MSLKKFIAQQNRVTAMFNGDPNAVVYPEDTSKLTTAHKQQLAQGLLSALSPENLCCDGELRGAELRAKSNLLNKAKADLEALDQKDEWDYA